MLLDVACKVQVMPRYCKVTSSNVIYATDCYGIEC